NFSGNVYMSLENFQKSLKISETIKDTNLIIESYYGLFHIYWGTKDYPSAFESVKKRIPYCINKGFEKDLAICYNNFALVYEARQQNDSAFYMYSKAIELAEKIDNKSLLALFCNNMGIFHQLNLLKPEEALKFQMKALKADLELNDQLRACYVMISIGRTLTEMGRLDSAKFYLTTGIQIAKEMKTVYELQEGYESLYNFYKKKNDFERSLTFLELSEQLKDSLYDTEKINALANLRLDYEIQKKEDQIEKNQEEIRNKNRLIINFVIFIAFGMIGGYLLYQSREEKKKINLILESKNEELIHKNEEISIQKDMLEEQHEEIQTQATQLAQVNDEITKINASLEEKVAHRTRELEEQNKKLLDYNFMNSHVLRSPVARLKGLFNLIEMEKDLGKKLEYMDLFKQSVEDLDNFTKTVSSRLNEGLDHDKNF
ncbi:MAG: tetratricopeptide repeat protein, partial [Cytophagales bacterium]|nr:tetratricopeptide repeat protein [Cytophagales bacterium]